jgi:hypothetical protein
VKLNLLFGIVLAMVLVTNGYALDQTACSNFPHQWGANITCLGKLEMGDMGAFSDHDGDNSTPDVWVWKPEFQTLFETNNWSPIPSIDELTPIQTNEIVPQSARFDNKRYPEDLSFLGLGTAMSRVVFQAAKNPTNVPSVWKMLVENPANFPAQPTWEGHTQEYPYEIIHTDWNMNPVCGDLCDDNGCPFDWCNDNGCPVVTGTDGVTECSWNDVQAGIYGGVSFDNIGEDIQVSDFQKVEWVDENQNVIDEALPFYIEIDDMWYMAYNTGSNSVVPVSKIYDKNSLYFHHFSKLAPKGVHYFKVYATNGQIFNLEFDIVSDTIMPVVGKTYSYAVEKINKSGRVIQTGQVITVENMKAREIIDNDGQKRLLIQFNEPDGAMMFTQNTRLRIWVGDTWIDPLMMSTYPGTTQAFTFLFIDVPVQIGSIVIPPEQYQWIKDKMIEKGVNSLGIGGMYREQRGSSPMNQYHNRGYIFGTNFQFTP